MALVVGISGGTGSGKTTVAKAVAGAFFNRSVLIEQELFYRDLGFLLPEERSQANFDHPDSLDLPLLLDVIRKLKAGDRVALPNYDFTTHTRKLKTTSVGPAEIVIVEGILLFHFPELLELFELKIFVLTDADVRLARRIRRDIEERGRTLNTILNQYFKTVKPMHEKYVEPSKYLADIILPEGGFNITGVETIMAQISRMLRMQQ